MVIVDERGEFHDTLELMSDQARREYQNQALRSALRRAYDRAPAAKEVLDGAGIGPDAVASRRDLEKIPITRKTDLMELQRRHPPYGGFVTVPLEEIERVFVAPGPLYEPLHGSDVEWFAKPFFAAGFRKGHVVVNTFTYHLSPAGMLLHEALRHCGCTVLVTGAGNTDIQLQALRDLGVNGFVGTPSFLMALISRAEEKGHDWRRDFSIRLAWFTGEMLSGSLRNALERDYGITTAQAYAVTEPGGALAYECVERSGMHLMDEYVIEIVDPGTGRQLDPGEAGEVVVTPTHNDKWGLIRFGTGDLSYFITEPCPCGRTSWRLGGILGRSGDAVKVRGMFVVGRQVEQVVGSFDEVARSRVVVGRRGQRDEITLRVELKEGVSAGDRLVTKLEESFRSVCRLKLDQVELLPPGSIDVEGVPIVDERTWD